MSNYLGIATVTAAFGQVVATALQTVPNLSAAPELRTGRPPMDPAFVGANLFLYRATPSPFRSNDDLATRAANGTVLARPRAALQLDYILSFYGNDLTLEPQRLMGATMAALHAFPVLSPDQIRTTVAGGGPGGYLEGSDLDAQGEPVRLSLAVMDMEALHRVWGLFYQVPYALSVAYSATTVMLDADLTPTPAQPVKKGGVALGVTPDKPRTGS